MVTTLTGCGGPKITGSTYDNIAGTWTGMLPSLPQAPLHNSTFTLTVAQSDAGLSGTYGVDGVLGDAPGAARKVSAAGNVIGTLNPGSFPAFDMTLLVPGCPSYRAPFGGRYDSANHRMIVSGPVDFFDTNTCNIVLTYPAVIVLSR